MKFTIKKASPKPTVKVALPQTPPPPPKPLPLNSEALKKLKSEPAVEQEPKVKITEGAFMDMDNDLYHSKILDKRGMPYYSSSRIKNIIKGSLIEETTKDHLEFGRLVHSFIETLIAGKEPCLAQGSEAVEYLINNPLYVPYHVKAKRRTNNKTVAAAIAECEGTNKVVLTDPELEAYEIAKKQKAESDGAFFFFKNLTLKTQADSVLESARVIVNELLADTNSQLMQEKSTFMWNHEIRKRCIEIDDNTLKPVMNMVLENELSIKTRFDLISVDRNRNVTLLDFKTTREQSVKGIYYAMTKYDYVFSLGLYAFMLRCMGYNVRRLKTVFFIKSDEPKPPVVLDCDLSEQDNRNWLRNELEMFENRARVFKVLKQLDPKNMKKIVLPMNRYSIK